MDSLEMQDAVMQGVARYQEWREKFLIDWNEQVERNNMAMAMAMMPPAMKELVRKEFPREFDELVRMLESKR